MMKRWLRTRLSPSSIEKLVTLRELGDWAKRKFSLPLPPLIKQTVVRKYARRFRLPTFVETGTYQGAMVAAMGKRFGRVITIELDPELHARAASRFADEPRVSVLRGDSAEVLGEVLERIHEPCLFWLDAHYSAGVTARGEVETPVLAELSTVVENSPIDSVVLIDDARCFTGTNDYPTIQDLEAELVARRPEWRLRVSHDIIRIHR